MGNAPDAEVDYVANVKSAYLAIADAQNKAEKAVGDLTVHAMDRVRSAFARVFGDSVDFPTWKVESGLNARGTGLTMDFQASPSESLMGEHWDEETWIYFQGTNMSNEEEAMALRVFVSLAQLSPTGISEL